MNACRVFANLVLGLLLSGIFVGASATYVAFSKETRSSNVISQSIQYTNDPNVCALQSTMHSLKREVDCNDYAANKYWYVGNKYNNLVDKLMCVSFFSIIASIICGFFFMMWLDSNEQ